jgi:hypothetical protein
MDPSPTREDMHTAEAVEPWSNIQICVGLPHSFILVDGDITFVSLMSFILVRECNVNVLISLILIALHTTMCLIS